MNFLVQKINGKLVHDFSFELTQAKEFYDWLGKEEMEITYFNTEGALVDGNIFNSIGFPDNFIPVGSVEFVSAYLKKFYPDSESMLEPLNVPESLFQFANRVIVNVRCDDDMKVFDEHRTDKDFPTLYRKSLTKIKDPANGIFNPDFSSGVGFQVSTPIDIQSEWRVFVFHDTVQHVSNYCGDPLLFPDSFEIRKMVSAYRTDQPVAYTLDVAVGGDPLFPTTSLIEVHRFFSCGLYGFSDHQRIPKMLSQNWYQMKTKQHIVR